MQRNEIEKQIQLRKRITKNKTNSNQNNDYQI
jgi:hypothetical protein